MAYQNYNYGTGGYVYPSYTNNFTMPPQYVPSAQMMQPPQQPQIPVQIHGKSGMRETNGH